jgi:GrpB-like predicted nucleotidyltransferase (UPF0157 family)
MAERLAQAWRRARVKQPTQGEAVESGELECHPTLSDRLDPAIRVVPYDPEWVGEFEREAAAIRSTLGDLVVRIEHVGSTAVPGLRAKAIIDIQVSLGDIRDRESFVRPLERLGYLFAPDPDSPEYHFFGKPRERPRRYHVHVCESGSEEERRHLAVRDFLRSHPDETARYADFKQDLAGRCHQDRLAYIEGKEPFMRDLEQRAIAWSRTRGRP